MNGGVTVYERNSLASKSRINIYLIFAKSLTNALENGMYYLKLKMVFLEKH